MNAPLLKSMLDHEPSSSSFLDEVLEGLGRPQKSLPCKYFYDQYGSQLFDQICDLDEYYLTRTELDIMESFGAEMAAQIGSGVRLVEFGSGSSVKTKILLDNLVDVAAYVPVDISRKHLQLTCNDLAKRYPALEVLPVCADFTTSFQLPSPCSQPSHTAVYFPGSTIGNFERPQAEQLLRQIAPLCGKGGGLLIGIDLQKAPTILEAAYDDAKGVTADFNLNLLRRINRELNADFRLEHFEHLALYNEQLGRIEMHLKSTCEQVVTVAGQPISFERNELICTEHSHKYTIEGFTKSAANVGLTLRKQWTDDLAFFAVLHFVIED